MADVPDMPHISKDINPGEVVSDMKAKRPLGVSILGWLHMIGAIFGIIASIFFVIFLVNQTASENQQAQEAMALLGMSTTMLLVAFVFLFVTVFASAVGMLRGKKWGWWLGSFYYIYSVFRNASALLNIYYLAEEIDLETSTRGPEFYYLKHGVRILIHALIFCYFFKDNVLLYFGLEDLKKARAVLILTGICIAITVLASIWSGMISLAK